MRKSERTSPRPRNRVLTANAANNPIGAMNSVTSNEKARLTQIEYSNCAVLNASM